MSDAIVRGRIGVVAVHQAEAEGPEHEAADADVDQVLHQDVDLKEGGLELEYLEVFFLVIIIFFHYLQILREKSTTSRLTTLNHRPKVIG